MIEFRSVGKKFADGTRAVADFSLTVPSHTTTVLVGSSGCGKTTLLILKTLGFCCCDCLRNKSRFVYRDLLCPCLFLEAAPAVCRQISGSGQLLQSPSNRPAR